MKIAMGNLNFFRSAFLIPWGPEAGRAKLLSLLYKWSTENLNISSELVYLASGRARTWLIFLIVERRKQIPCVFFYPLLSVPLEKVAQAFHSNSAQISFFSEISVWKGLSLMERIQVFPPRECQGPWVLDPVPALWLCYFRHASSLSWVTVSPSSLGQ